MQVQRRALREMLEPKVLHTQPVGAYMRCSTISCRVLYYYNLATDGQTIRVESLTATASAV